ncbi:MAG: hypothetical protein KJ941_12205 [Bacteroidetes bacterium]|nr:hypothetical protein [Bacteroidota bacterium]
MKSLIFITALILLSSCAVKIPLTKAIKEEYNLTAQNMKQVQFYVSSQIVIQRSSEKGTSGTNSDGTLVSSKNNEQDRIIILPKTKCVFEKFGNENQVMIRFETGDGKFIAFATRPNMDNGKFYLLADWQPNKGGRLIYGNEEYFATSISGDSFLMVKVKKSQSTKRKDRVVKGMKV